MMVSGRTKEGIGSLKEGEQECSMKKDRGIDRDKGAEVLIFPA